MSYKITFRDNTSVIVPNETGEKLKVSLVSDDKPEHFTLAGDVYRTSLIISVTHSTLPTAADADMTKKQLSPAPQYNCVLAGTSIQVAVHRAIKKQFPADWPKRVSNSAFREKVRQQIRIANPNKAYCDGHNDEHACLDFVPREGERLKLSSLL